MKSEMKLAIRVTGVLISLGTLGASLTACSPSLQQSGLSDIPALEGKTVSIAGIGQDADSSPLGDGNEAQEPLQDGAQEEATADSPDGDSNEDSTVLVADIAQVAAELSAKEASGGDLSTLVRPEDLSKYVEDQLCWVALCNDPRVWIDARILEEIYSQPVTAPLEIPIPIQHVLTAVKNGTDLLVRTPGPFLPQDIQRTVQVLPLTTHMGNAPISISTAGPGESALYGQLANGNYAGVLVDTNRSAVKSIIQNIRPVTQIVRITPSMATGSLAGKSGKILVSVAQSAAQPEQIGSMLVHSTFANSTATVLNKTLSTAAFSEVSNLVSPVFAGLALN